MDSGLQNADRIGIKSKKGAGRCPVHEAFSEKKKKKSSVWLEDWILNEFGSLCVKANLEDNFYWAWGIEQPNSIPVVKLARTVCILY